MKKAIVIGSGFSGLSAAAFLAKSKVKVTVIEKNQKLGGRARMIKENGITIRELYDHVFTSWAPSFFK